MSRAHQSGAQKRKLAIEKKKKYAIETEKLPKLTSFFAAKSNETLSTNQTEQNVDDHTSPLNTDLCNTKSVGDVKASEQSEMSVINDNFSSDPGKWVNLSKSDVAYWIDQGPKSCQNHDGPFENSARHYQAATKTRFCSEHYFIGTKPNGESATREWLLYSTTKGSVFCFVCKLFRPESSKFASQEGFNDWKNSCYIATHENSDAHRDCMLIYAKRRQDVQSDNPFTKQDKTIYWRQVLERVVEVICTLSERGLAFRGSNETFGSSHNGNYIGLLELIAKFDSFLAAHIAKYGHPGRGHTSYLSKTICEEIIGEYEILRG